MMDYIPRPGIVCTKICNKPMLIPSRQASEFCNTILPLSGSAYVVWTGIEKDYPLEKVLDIYSIFSKLDLESQKRRVEEQCEKFMKLGFVIRKAEKVSKE